MVNNILEMKIKANVVIKFTTQFNIAIWFCVLGIGFEGLKTKSFSNFDAFSFEPFFFFLPKVLF